MDFRLANKNDLKLNAEIWVQHEDSISKMTIQVDHMSEEQRANFKKWLLDKLLNKKIFVKK